MECRREARRAMAPPMSCAMRAGSVRERCARREARMRACVATEVSAWISTSLTEGIAFFRAMRGEGWRTRTADKVLRVGEVR